MPMKTICYYLPPFMLVYIVAIALLQSFVVEGLKPPRINPFHFSGELNEGLRTMVMCGIIDGDRPFEFKWFKDGDPLLLKRDHFSVESLNEFTSILTIENLNADSNGNYTCRVSNAAGSDEKSDVLTMKGEM
ncbi:titin [Nephila pilipes]|uniref:Titin n=1 Tax=Nephila pilipes TaxID=299642 RepID=A0A8X6TGW8_NEPPI|nr:titin [Nephila pilipes]